MNKVETAVTSEPIKLHLLIVTMYNPQAKGESRKTAHTFETNYV